MSSIKTYNVTKETVIAQPVALQTRTYKPVSNFELIDLTLGGIQKSGFKLDQESYSMAREGNVANGKYTLSNVSDGEMQIQVGWQNSYDKSISLKWAMGVHIFICSNGAISGDMGAFKRKHEGEIQTYTPYAISEYIKTAGDVFMQMQKEREKMKEMLLTKRITAEIIGRMFIEEKFIESTQLNIIKRELEHPTFDYRSPGSLWELYQYTTYSMKEIHPTLWMQDHIEAHKFFIEAAGIINPPYEPIRNQLNLFDETLTYV